MSADPTHSSAVAGPNGAHVRRPPDRRLDQLDRAEAMALLAGVEYGRVVFTDRALPAIRPVNHIIDGGDVIIRTRLAAAVSRTVTGRTGTVVAYQADQIDPARRLGWSVVVTGYANPVIEPAEIARLERALTPWVGMTMDTIIRIRPEIVSGFRLVGP